MTHGIRQANHLSSEVDPVSERARQEAAIFAEQQPFLGTLATNLVVAIGVSSDKEMQIRVTENFLDNVERATPHMSEAERREFAHNLVETADGRVKTDTAAALKAQNEILMNDHAMIRQILMGKSVEVLLEVAPYLRMPTAVEIDRTEFTGEIAIPTTNELEAQLTDLTEETRSPARGITIARSAMRQLVGVYGGVVGGVRHVFAADNLPTVEN
ncbi:MAG: hypothetical protein ABI351_14040 [Herbaspirillum sp.]